MATRWKIVIAIIAAIILLWFEKGAFSQDQKEKLLSPESRLELVRVVGGEFAKTTKPLPCGKKGFKIKAGEPVTDEQLRKGISDAKCITGEAGALVQIRLEFKDKEIQVDLNGGSMEPPKSFLQKLKEHASISVSGVDPSAPRVDTKTTTQNPNGQPPPTDAPMATPATIILDFGRPIPDMTPDDLKKLLSVVLDFSARSAAVQWVDTLPPEVQAAIGGKYVIPGMDKETVQAAIGKPDRRPRDESEDHIWTETWIYGEPPGPVLMVIFDKLEDDGKVACIKRPTQSIRCRASSRPDSAILGSNPTEPTP
jgi:hypothetical protein